MCGIAGLLNFHGPLDPKDARDAVVRMTRAVAHRGPDDEGIWASSDNTCVLGHRRLSVIDLSTAANQPMADPSGRYVTAFNGEIYNFQDLRAQLEAKGHVFKTHSDTEVLVTGFAAWGTDVFTKADGMFAVAIYDTEKKVLTLARDRAGEKPLYYAQSSGYFAFASELRALTTLPQFPYALSEPALALYMTLRYAPAPHTILENIWKLEAGSWLQIGPDGTPKIHRFFEFAIDYDRETPVSEIDSLADQIDGLLADALKVRLISDVPLGVFLSSGIDSALACAIVAKKLGRAVSTFTVGFENDAESEHVAARAIARHLGTQHSEYIFGKDDFEQACGKIGKVLDEPNGDRSCVPTYLLSKFTREHVTVALSGDGGDELFGGYGRYVAFANMAQTRQWPSPVHLTRAYFESALPVFPLAAVPAVGPRGVEAVSAFFERRAKVFTRPKRAVVDSLRLLDFDTYMPGAVLPKVDRMSMQHALEVRTPFLFGPLMALAGKTSASACIAGNTQKVVLRRLAGRYLPAEHAAAPKKGFGMPHGVFLQSQERLVRELNQAHEILNGTRFFAARSGAAATILSHAVKNINAIWASIVLARWIESTGLKL